MTKHPARPWCKVAFEHACVDAADCERRYQEGVRSMMTGLVSGLTGIPTQTLKSRTFTKEELCVVAKMALTAPPEVKG